MKAIDVAKFKQKVSVSTEHCLKHAHRSTVSVDEIAFTVYIPYEIFELLTRFFYKNQ